MRVPNLLALPALLLLTAGCGPSANTSPTTTAAAVHPDHAAVLGTWQQVGHDSGKGGKGPPQHLMPRLVFETDGKLRVVEPTGREQVSGYKLDPSATPKAIDLTTNGAKVALGVYELDGDTLKLCVAPSDSGVRPTAMKPDADAMVVLMTLTRVAGK